MARIANGILGGFSGKVGTVVGSSWNSINYMRSLAASYSDAKSETQVCQRGKFTQAVRFLKAMPKFIRVGFGNHARGQSAYSEAMSYLLRYAAEGCGEEATLNYDKVLVSRGSLMTAGGASVSADGSSLTFTWTDNSGVGNAMADDVALVLAYDKERQEAVYDLSAATRADGTAGLTLPSHWADDALAVYLGFCSADGKEVANSVCLQNDGVTTQPGGETGGGEGGDDEDLFG